MRSVKLTLFIFLLSLCINAQERAPYHLVHKKPAANKTTIHNLCVGCVCNEEHKCIYHSRQNPSDTLDFCFYRKRNPKFNFSKVDENKYKDWIKLQRSSY